MDDAITGAKEAKDKDSTPKAGGSTSYHNKGKRNTRKTRREDRDVRLQILAQSAADCPGVVCHNSEFRGKRIVVIVVNEAQFIDGHLVEWKHDKKNA